MTKGGLIQLMINKNTIIKIEEQLDQAFRNLLFYAVNNEKVREAMSHIKLAKSFLDPTTHNDLTLRPSWDKYFMTIAKTVASRSTCIRRQIGCVIVKDNRILSTGYNGAASGCSHCTDQNYCWREENKIPSGEKLDRCFAAHAEVNAIAQAAKFGTSINESDLYCTNLPCFTCAKTIVNAGISQVIYKGEYPDDMTKNLFEEAGVILFMIP